MRTRRSVFKGWEDFPPVVFAFSLLDGIYFVGSQRLEDVNPDLNGD